MFKRILLVSCFIPSLALAAIPPIPPGPATPATTNASQLTSGTLPCGRMPALTGDVTLSAGACATTYGNVVPATKGGAGTITGALKGSGAGVVTQAACADLSNGATGCSTVVGTMATQAASAVSITGGTIGTAVTAATQAANDNSTKLATTAQVKLSPIHGYIAGCTLSTAGSSSTFGVSACTATDTAITAMMNVGSAYTKTTSAWAVGSGNGCLDTGTIANSTWYHAFEIERLDTGVVDYLCSTSATSPSMPTSYTINRRLGAMKTDGSAHWTAFLQVGDLFSWMVPTFDVNTTTLGTTATLFAVNTPPGVSTVASLVGYAENVATTAFLISSPLTTDTLPAVTGIGMDIFASGGSLDYVPVSVQILTDTSHQIRLRASNASTVIGLTLTDWRDSRGKEN